MVLIAATVVMATWWASDRGIGLMVAMVMHDYEISL